MQMSEPTHSDFWNLTGRVATQCEVSERPTHSALLDRHGRPMRYEPSPIGFDLSSKRGGGDRK